MYNIKKVVNGSGYELWYKGQKTRLCFETMADAERAIDNIAAGRIIVEFLENDCKPPIYTAIPRERERHLWGRQRAEEV